MRSEKQDVLEKKGMPPLIFHQLVDQDKICLFTEHQCLKMITRHPLAILFYSIFIFSVFY